MVGLSEGGESAGFYCRGVIENIDWTTTIFGGGSCTELADEDTNWDAQVVVDDPYYVLSVQVKGYGETIRWVASVRTVEVGW